MSSTSLRQPPPLLPPGSSVNESSGRTSPTTVFVGLMDKGDLPVISDPGFCANIPTPRRRKRAMEGAAAEAPGGGALSPPKSQHATMTSLGEPASSEWRRSETVCSMLKVFHTATQVVSGSTYPTSNLYFHQVWNVKILLEKEASRKDQVIHSMVKAMQEKFDKYWTESYLANSIPVILDPRFKYGFIEFRLEQAFGSNVATHLGKVKDALDSLFKEYSSQMARSLNESTQGENIDEVVMEEDNPLADWDKHLRKKQCQPTNELDRYLQEETFPRKDDFDILQWWNLHSSKYPVLSQIARDILAVPASVVPSESAFSTGQRVISDYRSRLDSKTVEALICLQDWLKRYTSLADIVDDNDL